MALSYVTYIGDGATTTYNYGSISVLKDGVVPVVSQLVVTIDDVAVPASTYSVNTVTSNLTFFTAPSTDAVVVITRVTKSDDRYVDWTNSTNLSQEQLNLDSDQLLFLAQEGLDSAQLTIRLNALNKWDAEGNVISNVGIGTDSNDAVNVQQLNTAVFGGTPGVVTGQQYLRSANGETVFTLPSLHGQDADDVNVFKNGLRLVPTDDYTVADDSDGSSLVLTLLSNPGSDLIEITFVTGIMAASLGDDTITNESIKDGVITPDKLLNPGLRKLIINNPETGPEWADLTASDVNAANNADLPTHSLSELAVPTGDLSVGNFKVTSVADPTDVQDAVNLQTLQNQIAALQGQITASTEFKKGTIAGTLVQIDFTSGFFFPAGPNPGAITGSWWFWADPLGTDLLNTSDGNFEDWLTHLDPCLIPKDDFSPIWPLSSDLTFVSKNPSEGAMDVDLFNLITLPADVGRIGIGALSGSPRKYNLSQVGINNSQVTTGGKMYQHIPFQTPSTRTQSGSTVTQTNGQTAVGSYETAIRPDNGQVLTNNRFRKFVYPFVRTA